MDIRIPDYVNSALRTLTDAGQEAFLVGGCVRDILMGKEPADWDICTSAEPEQIKKAFCRYKTIDTGIKHGTVAVLTSGGLVEITTYRIDGEYLDNRHPKAVAFTSSLTEDLARRDFTMNAIAYSPGEGLIDPFGGQKAIADRKIQCVGEPKKRFEEDALRILRGLRFAAVLGFQIDEASAAAMEKCGSLIKKMSAERINAELSKLIMADSADEIIGAFEGVIKTAAPGFSAAPLNDAPHILAVRLCLLFPEDTEAALRRLKYDNRTIKNASALARLFKGAAPEGEVEIKKHICREGEEIARMYFETAGRRRELEKILESGQCCSMRQLAVNGRDLLDAGINPGAEVGQALDWLLQLVIEGKEENQKELLIKRLR